MVAISAPSFTAQAPARKDRYSAAFSALLERAQENGHLYEGDIQRFLDSLPFDPSGRLRAAVLQELLDSDVDLLEGAPPSGRLQRMLETLDFWKKAVTLGLLTTALIGHEVLVHLRTPALPWPQ